MLIYLLKGPAEIILNSCRRVGGWLTLSVPHHLYVKHFKVDAITLLWWLRVSILQQSAEKGSFLQNKLKWWWCVPFVPLLIVLPSWWFITIQIESIYISLALVKWAFQLDWIRIWEVKKSNISWFSISVHDLSRKLRYQTWICVLPLNKNRNRSNQSSHTMTILFSGPWINPPTHQSIHSQRNVRFMRMGNIIFKWSWFRI